MLPPGAQPPALVHPIYSDTSYLYPNHRPPPPPPSVPALAFPEPESYVSPSNPPQHQPPQHQSPQHQSPRPRTPASSRPPNPSFLSHLARFLKTAVPLQENTRGAIPFPNSFTGATLVDSILPLLPPAFHARQDARLFGLSIARSLQDNLFFFDVDYSGIGLRDDHDKVYVFADSSLFSSHQQPLPTESAELPTGVLTAFTACYSPLCPRVVASTSICYSPGCPLNPNSPQKFAPLVIHNNTDPSITSSIALASSSLTSSADSNATANDSWVETVSPELLKVLTKDEIARQNDIHSFIKTEVDYLADLRVLNTEFVIPITQSNPPIIAPELQPQFFDDVLLNMSEIVHHVQRLVDNLLRRQMEQSPCIHALGDLALDAALDWGDAYVYYAVHLPFAKERIKRECRFNPAFQDFITTFSRREGVRKLEFDSFHSRATHRMLRYSLQLREILKHTPSENQDRISITSALDILTKQSAEANVGIAHTDMVLSCIKYNSGIVYKDGRSPELDLLSESRQIFFQGKMFRRVDSTVSNDKQELWVILFDHFLVITKIRKRGEELRYQLVRRPIPLELLSAYGFDDPPTTKGFHLSNIARLERGGSDTLTVPSSPANAPGGDSASLYSNNTISGHENSLQRAGSVGTSNSVTSNSSRSHNSENLYPITIRALSRYSDIMTLFVESSSARKQWKEKLIEATGLRDAVLDSQRVFDTSVMSSDLFMTADPTYALNQLHHSNSFISNSGPQNLNNSTHSHFSPAPAPGIPSKVPRGRPNCTVPFSTPEGHQLLAVGHNDGLWIGLRHDPRTLRTVLHLNNITQVAVLEEFRFVLILANGILLAYPLDTLVPSPGSAASNTPAVQPDRLSGNKEVLYFNVGRVGARTLVIYAKKGGVNQTNFKALEPISNSDRPQRTGFMMRRKPEWFRLYKEFFIPSVAHSIMFLRSQLCILCSKGFELLSLQDDTPLPKSLPDWSLLKMTGEHRASDLQKRVANAKALGMFRTTPDTFLFCFDELAFFTDRHGDPKRYDDIILWEGEPRAVSYYPPYIIAVNDSFVEIHHAHTGKLVQIIQGTHMLLTYDGQMIGADSQNVISITNNNPNSQNGYPSHDRGQGSIGSFSDVHLSDMKRPHITMRVNKSYQIFELRPQDPNNPTRDKRLLMG